VASDALAVRGRLVSRYKEGLIDNAAVIISALAVLIAAGALMFAGISLYASADIQGDLNRDMTALKNEFRLSELYVDDLVNVMEAHDLEIPEKN